MPCVMQDWERRLLYAEDEKRLRDQADKMANMLCRVLRAMPADQAAKLDPDIAAWFAEHKEFDAKQVR